MIKIHGPDIPDNIQAGNQQEDRSFPAGPDCHPSQLKFSSEFRNQHAGND